MANLRKPLAVLAASGIVITGSLAGATAASAVEPQVPAATQVPSGPTPEQLAAANRQLVRYSKAAGTSYWTMAAGHNCTNYVAWRLIKLGMPRDVDWLHNGSQWAKEARAKKIPVDHEATVGAVAQWNAGTPGSSSGHVAYVEAVGDSWILISEDNYASGPRQTEVIYAGSPQWPTHFIHFATSVTAPVTPGTPTPTDWQELLQLYYLENVDR